MRLATLLAAIRRGWVWPISLPVLARPRPRARAILGSCVVLPEPVSPQTMMTWCSDRACAMSSRRLETGSDSGKLMGGSGLATMGDRLRGEGAGGPRWGPGCAARGREALNSRAADYRRCGTIPPHEPRLSPHLRALVPLG